jgi:hypothetical protein
VCGAPVRRLDRCGAVHAQGGWEAALYEIPESPERFLSPGARAWAARD